MQVAMWEGVKGLMVGTLSITTEKVVLVVDDDPGIRDILTEVISARGNKVVTVDRAEEAVEQVKKQHFHLMFLDWTLPGMSGIEALSAIKAVDDKIIAVVITGYGDILTPKEKCSLGVQLLISKPFQLNEIISVLNKVNTNEKLYGTSHDG
jgi:DNA-binding NtrC family response regulator